MKKLLLFLFICFAVICKAGVEINYGLRFQNGLTGVEFDKFSPQVLHAGVSLDLSEKCKIGLNAECNASLWQDIKNMNFSTWTPTWDITVTHKL